MTDKDIITLFWLRDQKAIAETKKKYGNYCRSIAYNILKNKEDAEECENDTYLGAWDSIPPQIPKSLPAYLAKITRNLSITRLRSKKAEKRLQDNQIVPIEELYSCISDTSGFDAHLSEKELGEIIDKFLRSLKESDRNIFICRYWYSEEISVIAKNFGFTESKVKTCLFRTKNKFRKHLNKEGVLI